MIIGHGGNKRHLAARLGCGTDDIIDMSSNLNPLGPPQRVDQVIRDSLAEIRSLPEPDALSIRQGFADFYEIDKDRVVAGNGTTWFIYTIPKALGSKKVLILGPSYSDYKDACRMHGIDFRYVFSRPDNDFIPDMDRLAFEANGADTVFICNPNNPTGALISKEKLAWLMEQLPKTVFIVDESYLPFVEHAERETLVPDTQYQNLIVLSSMSKIFRIPGLRTGFLSASRSICRKIMDYYQPWSVNAIAQAVIKDIFDHSENILPFYRKTREFIRAEKQLFLENLGRPAGLTCFPSSTYFLLAKLVGGLKSAGLCDEIGRHRILIRDCSNFDGLSDAYVRFSLKQRRENNRLAELIKAALTHV